MRKPTYRNLLSIKQQSKGVPYWGAGEPRPEDGEANFGFKNLKSDPAGIATIPEIARDPALGLVAEVLNRPNSGFFTVGCTSGDVAEERGFRRSGYIEFAANSVRLVADASNYFPLFFHFDGFLSKADRQHEVAFEWELMGASFLCDKTHPGFTCGVFINTFFVASAEDAQAAWHEALELLASYFQKWGHKEDDPIHLTLQSA